MGLSDEAKEKAQNVEDFIASAKEQLNAEEAAFDALAKEHAPISTRRAPFRLFARNTNVSAPRLPPLKAALTCSTSGPS